MSSLLQRGRTWADDRFRVSWTLDALRARSVAVHDIESLLGTSAAFLFLLEVATGVLLLTQYRPSAGEAHASIVHIDEVVPFGALVRALHLWSSDLLVGALCAYAFTVVVRRTFRAPRELLWWAGLLALGLVLGLAFTGSLLPWSRTARGNAEVASALAGHVPAVGPGLRTLLLGADRVSAAALVRAFGLHVAVLPLALALIGIGRLALASLGADGSDDSSAPRARRIPVYPDFVVRQAAAWTGLLLVLLTLATFVPRSPGEAMDPSAPSPAGARPPWYFLFLHEIVRVAPRDMLGVQGPTFVMGAILALAGALLLLPFLDRGGSRLTMYIACAALVALAVLTAHALA